MSHLSPQEPRIATVDEDTTPQLGGNLDVNGYTVTTINGVGNDITITTSAASPSGSSGNVTVAAANANAVVNSLIAGQDETNYLFDFNGGTGHAVSDVITMTDGSTVTVDAVDGGGAVTQFTVTTSGGVDVPIQPHPQNLLQSSTTGVGTGFFLQPDGANVVQDAQTGGNLTLTAGDGGTSTTGGGDVTITSGRQRGEILIKSGDARTTGNGAYAGKIDIEVGTSFQNSGEHLSLTAGSSDYELGDAFGGNVRIAAGNAFGTGGDPSNSYGGNVIIEGGAAQYSPGTDPYEGGEVRLLGGASTYYGGDILITGGVASGADGIGGNIIISTPNAGYGASIQLYGGNASFAGANGADIRIKAGNSASAAGGDVEFTFGTGSTTAGAMVINPSAAPSVTTNKLYNVAGALTWNGTTISAGGDVTKVGTPVNNELAVWTGDGTLEGESNMTFVGGALTLGISAGGEIRSGAGRTLSIIPGSGGVNMTLQGSANSSGTGGPVFVTGGNSTLAAGVGGAVTITGGAPGAQGNGGAANLRGANGGSTSGNGGAVLIDGGNGSGDGHPGGAVLINGGDGDTTGSGGVVTIQGGTRGATGGGGGAASLIGGTGGAVGGQVNVTGGVGNATNAVGGAAVVTGGAGVGTNDGGDARLTGGTGGATGNGGQVELLGGDGGATSGNGADVTIAGGTGDVNGSIRLNSDTVLNGAFVNTIGTLANSATPSVAGGRVFLTGGTTTITDFTGGATGQEIIILSEHAITITDGTNIFLAGSTNFVMASTDSLHLIQKADGNWYEISRSVN